MSGVGERGDVPVEIVLDDGVVESLAGGIECGESGHFVNDGLIVGFGSQCYYFLSVWNLGMGMDTYAEYPGRVEDD